MAATKHNLVVITREFFEALEQLRHVTSAALVSRQPADLEAVTRAIAAANQTAREYATRGHLNVDQALEHWRRDQVAARSCRIQKTLQCDARGQITGSIEEPIP